MKMNLQILMKLDNVEVGDILCGFNYHMWFYVQLKNRDKGLTEGVLTFTSKSKDST